MMIVNVACGVCTLACVSLSAARRCVIAPAARVKVYAFWKGKYYRTKLSREKVNCGGLAHANMY